MKQYCIALILLCLVHCASSQDYTGRVVGISDGDTFTLLTGDKKQIKVRLAEVDTPESSQPYGTRAKEKLSDLIFAKDVRVEKADIDRYGRLVGRVYLGAEYINRRMVQEGMAWVYRQYLEDKTLLVDEQKAKEAKRGLWSLPSTEQVPPWEWRQGSRAAKPSKAEPAIKGAVKFKCAGKTKCSEMVSCEEARFYLEHCGLSRIDGDGDGVPCESLCN